MISSLLTPTIPLLLLLLPPGLCDHCPHCSSTCRCHALRPALTRKASVSPYTLSIPWFIYLASEILPSLPFVCQLHEGQRVVLLWCSILRPKKLGCWEGDFSPRGCESGAALLLACATIVPSVSLPTVGQSPLGAGALPPNAMLLVLSILLRTPSPCSRSYGDFTCLAKVFPQHKCESDIYTIPDTPTSLQLPSPPTPLNSAWYLSLALTHMPKIVSCQEVLLSGDDSPKAQQSY